jgi:hypothetical protein
MDPDHTPGGASAPPNVQIEASLKGALPCVRCRYDLYGLSVREVCPECGTPIRATLLAVVDPHANELRPLYRPYLTAIGVVAWTVGALAGALLLWWVRLEALILELPAPRGDWVAGAIPVCAGVSGLGAAALVRPHAGVPGRLVFRAGVGVLLYAPLVAVLWRLLLRHDPLHATPFSFGEVDDSDRVWFRLLASALIVMIVLCLRSSARMLAARSLVMRTGRVDRQTMFALIATVGLWLIGDTIGLVALATPGATESIFSMVSTIFIAAGSGLFTLGLAWMVWDTLRLAPILIEPSPALGDVVEFSVADALDGPDPAPGLGKDA